MFRHGLVIAVSAAWLTGGLTGCGNEIPGGGGNDTGGAGSGGTSMTGDGGMGGGADTGSGGAGGEDGLGGAGGSAGYEGAGGAGEGGTGGVGGAGTGASGGTGGGGGGGGDGGGDGDGDGDGGGGSGGGGSGGGGVGGSGTGGSGGAGGAILPADACDYGSDGVWFEIDYANAYSATNPSWTYSPTPGWSEAQWAPDGEDWPEVWDLYNNIEVADDPYGTVADIGSSAQLQIMIGLGGLTSYTHATVCIEGRSISTSSSVTVEISNPAYGCGVELTQGNSWWENPAGADLGACLVAGDNFQAIRIDPIGGSSHLGLQRLRFTLHGATY